MFQFGELLALCIGLVALVYLLAHRRRIAAEPALHPFAVPFLLMLVAWIATVLEGVHFESGDIPWLVFGQESLSVARRSITSELLNLAEHAAYAAGAVGLLVVLWRNRRAVRKAPS